MKWDKTLKDSRIEFFMNNKTIYVIERMSEALMCCKTLYKLENGEEYMSRIEKYFTSQIEDDIHDIFFNILIEITFDENIMKLGTECAIMGSDDYDKMDNKIYSILKVDYRKDKIRKILL